MRLKFILLLSTILSIQIVLAGCSSLLNRNAPGYLGGSVLVGQETARATLEALSTSAEFAKGTAFAEFDAAQETLQSVEKTSPAPVEPATSIPTEANDTQTTLITSTPEAVLPFTETPSSVQKSVVPTATQSSTQPEPIATTQPVTETATTIEATSIVISTQEVKSTSTETSAPKLEGTLTEGNAIFETTTAATPFPSQTSQAVCPCAPLTGGDSIRQQVAFLLNTPPENLQFLTSEKVEWPDSCLGLIQPSEVCAQVITPGYKGTVQFDGQIYTFHSDLDGKQVRLETSLQQTQSGLIETPTTSIQVTPTLQPTATPLAQHSPTSTPTSVPATEHSSTPAGGKISLPEGILDRIARLLGVRTSRLTADEVKQHTWTDGCIDFTTQPSGACTSNAITGYEGIVTAKKVIFGGDPIYLFRSDQRGDRISLLPIAAQKAAEMLAAKQSRERSEVDIVKVSPFEWPTTCALLPTPIPADVYCVQVPLPGWQVILKTGNTTYQFHTDLNGDTILPANP